MLSIVIVNVFLLRAIKLSAIIMSTVYLSIVILRMVSVILLIDNVECHYTEILYPVSY
jgi:hypothetical protein